MSDNMRVFLIGTGYMACEYARVLQGMQIEPIVIGRGKKSAEVFEEKTGISPIVGGAQKYISDHETFSGGDCAIVSVGVEDLCNVANLLIANGLKNLLIEKPGFFTTDESKILLERGEAKIFIAYNRRFYASVLAAQRIIEQDGGLLSARAEFTEWADVIKKTNRSDDVKQKLFLTNSSHVMDLCFYIIGKPETIDCYKSGSLDWHLAGSEYAGAGVSEKKVLFSYSANWGSAGRWGLELCTPKRKLILTPLESLKEQLSGSVHVSDVVIDDEIDREYKPGLYREVKAFLEGKDAERLCTIKEQAEMMDIYQKISGEEY